MGLQLLRVPAAVLGVEVTKEEKEWVKAIREHYIPALRKQYEEHEQWCKEHPEIAAWLASLPNGGWRKKP